MIIPVNEPDLSGNELNYLTECITSGWISSEGPFVERFETNFAARVGRKYGVALSNGSVALDLAFQSVGLSEGDEVILPSFTIISCVAEIVRIGAVPVFVDSDEGTWNMNLSQIEQHITHKTKAILAVHIYGLPVDLDPIILLCKKYNLLLIEDAAEMHGQDYKGKPIGSFGDLSIFSFYPNKHITTGEGGMILTNNYELSLKLRESRNLGFCPPRRFVHYNLGWNYRMTNLQAALGCAQLERLDEFIIKKRKIGKIYHSHLHDLSKIDLQLKETPFAENIYWVFGILLHDYVGYTAIDIMSKLNSLGVQTRPFFYPLHKQPLFGDQFKDICLPISEKLGEFGFYLPSGLGTSEDQIIKAAKITRELLCSLGYK